MEDFGFIGGGTDPADAARIANLENNEYKITYYEVVTGTSGSLTIPVGATINTTSEFGASGNALLSKIDGANKPTFVSPQTSGGVVVTASVLANGSWTASGAYTDTSVALIYSIRIKAVNYVNLNYARIVESEEIDTAALLTGLDTGLSGLITASDSILSGFGRVQNQINTINVSGTTDLAPVISRINTPVPTPATNDRFLVDTAPTGAFVGHANEVATWDGAAYVFYVPVLNNTVYVTATLTTLRFNGTAWVAYNGTAVLHNGNKLGQNLVIGTNDNFAIDFKTNGILRLSVGSFGAYFKNQANTYTAAITNTVTANRIITLPDVTTTLVGKVGTPVASHVAYFNDANQLTANVGMVYNGVDNLQVGVGAMSYANKGFSTHRDVAGSVGYYAQNINIAGLSATLLIESATGFGGLVRYNSAYVGDYAGTVVNLKDTTQIQSGSGNDKTFVLGCSPLICIVGSATANQGFRQDTIGFRGGANSTLNDPNTVPFQINNFLLPTSQLTAARTYTFQDKSGTVAHLDDITSIAVLQGGNTIGAALTVGTNDLFPLNLEVNNSTKLTIGTDGNVVIGANQVANPKFLKVGNANSWIDMGVWTASTAYASMYFNQVTPGGTNFTMICNGVTTLLNAPTSAGSVQIQVANATKLYCDANRSASFVPMFVGGNISPTGILTIAAGGTGANTAPLRFTQGGLLLGKAPGALEYNGNYYITHLGSIRYSLGGSIHDDITSTGSSTTVETDIRSYPVAASSLFTNNDKLKAEYGGTFVAHATDTRRVKLYFAGSVLFDSGALVTTVASFWDINLLMTRVSATVVRYKITFTNSSGSSQVKVGELAAIDLAVSNILKVTGTGVVTNDIVAMLSNIDFKGAAA